VRTIIIGLSASAEFSIFSWLIKKVLKTKYSHAYVRLHDELTNIDMVYQASGPYVNFQNMDDFVKSETIVREYPISVTEETYAKVMSFCEKKVGKPYALRNIFAIFIYHLTGKKILKSDKDECKFICSELVAEILEICGILDKKVDLDYFTPLNVDETMGSLLN
jgi:uncharacterized protein YycO